MGESIKINGGHAVKDGGTLYLYRDVGSETPQYHGFVLGRQDLINIIKLFDIDELVKAEKLANTLPY